MDKVKEVLKYQFWILLGIALILPLVGWFMSTSGLVSEAEVRTKELTELHKSLTIGPEDPNSDWSNRLEDVNKEQAKQKEIAWREVYNRQKEMMTWPEKTGITELSQIQDWQVSVYRVEYQNELKRVYKIVRPIEDDSSKGLLEFPEEQLPAPDQAWKTYRPTIGQIAAAQEDLWLLSALLECIAAVNEGANTPFEAPIRQIDLLHLRGGSKGGTGAGSSGKTTSPTNSPGPQGTGAGGMMAAMKGGMAGPGDMMNNMSKSMSGGMFGGAAAGGQSGGTRINDPKIDADDVLGQEQSAATETTKDAKSSTVAFGTAEKSRYRQEGTEWKTRGFELQVTMDHKRVPELLVSLSNCDWPLSILRVQEADVRDENLETVESGGSRGSSFGGGPMGMSGGMGNMMRGMAGAGAMMGGGPPGGTSKGAAMSRGNAGSMMMKPAQRPARNARHDDDEDEDAGGVGDGMQRSPLDDPNLALVSIVGVIYIFKEPSASTTGPGSPGAPVTSPEVAAPNGAVANGDSPATDTAAPADAAAPAAEETAKAEAADDDEKKEPEPQKSGDDEPDESGAQAEKPEKSE
jgi:hypothetical protein